MKKITVTVGIPAYNEEKNLGFLLDDILSQKFAKEFSLKEVIVVSDCSTDRTDEIVKEKAKRSAVIKLLRNQERQGKIAGLKKLFSNLKTDILVLLDADVRLVDETTLNNLVIPFLRNNEIGLVGGNPVPEKPKKQSFSSRASVFSFYLLQAIKKAFPDSIYSSHGRILALSKRLAQVLAKKIIFTPGDDQFLYLACLEDSKKFVYEPLAKVYYHLPVKVKDYLNQNLRFRVGVEKKIQAFGEWVKSQFQIKNRFWLFLKTWFLHPVCGFCWLCLYSWSAVLKCFGFHRRKYDSPLYKVATSTK